VVGGGGGLGGGPGFWGGGLLGGLLSQSRDCGQGDKGCETEQYLFLHASAPLGPFAISTLDGKSRRWGAREKYGGLNTMGRRGVPADPLFSNRASYQEKRPVGGRPDQRRLIIMA
jgi:hypothetical protein